MCNNIIKYFILIKLSLKEIKLFMSAIFARGKWINSYSNVDFSIICKQNLIFISHLLLVNLLTLSSFSYNNIRLVYV